MCHGAAACAHQTWWKTCKNWNLTDAVLADAYIVAAYVLSTMLLWLLSVALVASFTKLLNPAIATHALF